MAVVLHVHYSVVRAVKGTVGRNNAGGSISIVVRLPSFHPAADVLVSVQLQEPWVLLPRILLLVLRFLPSAQHGFWDGLAIAAVQRYLGRGVHRRRQLILGHQSIAQIEF